MGGVQLLNKKLFRIEFLFINFLFSKKNIGASIRIGQEIRCLPYAEFLHDTYDIPINVIMY